jgi:hypothetical protein
VLFKLQVGLSNSLYVDQKHRTIVHTYVKTINSIASKYAPSRKLSFSEVHVFKALQLMKDNGRISRELLCHELGLGEGAIKTFVKHMKMNDMIETSNGGTKMTSKGKAICNELTSSIPAETSLPNSSIALGRFNHAVLLKGLSYSIKSGIEQRDSAIRMNAIGATTLLFKDNKFVMPTTPNSDSLKLEPGIRKHMIEKLRPAELDAIIIGSADDSQRTAELAAKNAALMTLVGHENHSS